MVNAPTVVAEVNPALIFALIFTFFAARSVNAPNPSLCKSITFATVILPVLRTSSPEATLNRVSETLPKLVKIVLVLAK